MSVKTLIAAAALVATAGAADAQVIYSGGGFSGAAPGLYGSGYSVPGQVPAVSYPGGVNTRGFYNTNFGNLNAFDGRGVINAGAPFTPLYGNASGYLPGAGFYNRGSAFNNFGTGYNSSPLGSYGPVGGYNPLGGGLGYNNFGTGYGGAYNAGYYSPGYVGGYTTTYGNRPLYNGGYRLR